MKKRAIFILGLICILTFLFHKISSQPGSVQDPVITKSYLENYYNFQILVLLPEEKLIPATGSELMLRTGKAIIIKGKTEQGLVDLTTGEELKPGSLISINHLLINPRSDGRGIKAKSKVILLIRGSREIDGTSQD